MGLKSEVVNSGWPEDLQQVGLSAFITADHPLSIAAANIK
jgi:hypothetical protein